MLKIYNTLSRKVEEFKPINPPKVGMYACGPTVYDDMHIGNLRTFVLADNLKRVLEYNGFKVKSVINITDLDDKIIAKAKTAKWTISRVTKVYTLGFLIDARQLNIQIDDYKLPRARRHIKEMIDYIKILIDKNLAYVRDGSVYFDISEFSSYGMLSRLDTRSLKTGTRTLSDTYTKDDVQDFALWKEDKGKYSYDSPWGKGRPGWHIECSVMSQKVLGQTIDIHLGGVDLIFPHHENEIAQSEGVTGKKFVNYFVHGAHLFVEGQKMSKSLGNYIILRDLWYKRYDLPLALRYLYLQTHYRQEMNFTWEALEDASKALNRLKKIVEPKKPSVLIPSSKIEEELKKAKKMGWKSVKWEGAQLVEDKNLLIGCAEYEQRFLEAVNDDLNMPKALSIVWELLRSDYPHRSKIASYRKMDRVLGLDLLKPKFHMMHTPVPEKVKELIKEREGLRRQKKFYLADQLRNKIKKLGFIIEDKDDGGAEVYPLHKSEI